VVNDHVAHTFMVEALRKGIKVPEELSIVGLDDQPIAAYCPVPMTAASHPADEIAGSVVSLLLDRLSGKTTARQSIVIRGGISERQSVATITPE
jgi:LacI family repressor for deo operon, udp, cdd, tsx, nupC, and nupG